MKYYFCLSLLFFFIVPVPTALASHFEPIKIGVLAYRPIPETLRRWKPLEGYLKEKIPGYDFIVEPLAFDDLRLAVASRQIDFILTNPGYYIQLKQQYNLSSPLASLIKQTQQQSLSAFAGVIFTLTARVDINELKDLTHKRVAVTKTTSLGGYQMQGFELIRAGLPLPDKENLYLTGMPHDNVVNAVLTGKVDVGFVRTGVLESLQMSQGLDLSQIKIINSQKVPSFPFKLSTRLYPEWPFAALPHIDSELASHFTAALLLMHEHEVHNDIGINGFTIPMDYSPVEDVLRELRFPPFEAPPHFTMDDIWLRYSIQIKVGAVLVLLIVVLSLYLVVFNRRMASQKQQTIEDGDRYHTLLSSLAEGVYGVNSQGVCTFVNPAALNMLDYTKEQVVGVNQHQLFHHHRSNKTVYPEQECPITLTISDSKTRHCEDSFIRQGGSVFPVVMNIAAMQISSLEQGAVVAFRDISQEKKIEGRNNMLVAALKASQTSIMVVDKQAMIQWVNPAFEALTGFGFSEVIGYTPLELLDSAVQSDEFNQALWSAIQAGKHWSGELVNQRKNGRFYDEELSISPVLDEDEEVQYFIIAKNDISERKRIEKHMQHLVEHDQLTNLPNRILLSNLLEQSINIAKRNKQKLALMFLDLDKFKPVNDDYGHDVGDVLLKQVALRISACLRESDTVARVGGDEFIILLPEVKNEGDALTVAEKIRSELSQPFYYQKHCLQISSSIGVAIYPEHGENEINLAKSADIAMYYSKQQGRNNVQTFNKEMLAE